MGGEAKGTERGGFDDVGFEVGKSDQSVCLPWRWVGEQGVGGGGPGPWVSVGVEGELVEVSEAASSSQESGGAVLEFIERPFREELRPTGD